MIRGRDEAPRPEAGKRESLPPHAVEAMDRALRGPVEPPVRRDREIVDLVVALVGFGEKPLHQRQPCLAIEPRARGARGGDQQREEKESKGNRHAREEPARRGGVNRAHARIRTPA